MKFDGSLGERAVLDRQHRVTSFFAASVAVPPESVEDQSRRVGVGAVVLELGNAAGDAEAQIAARAITPTIDRNRRLPLTVPIGGEKQFAGHTVRHVVPENEESLRRGVVGESA